MSANKEVCNIDNLFNSCELGVKGAKKYNIGSCINKASSMFAVRSQYNEDSEEYKELSERIMLSQAISQSYIDYRKSGSAFDMPKHWSSQKGVDLLDIEEQFFNSNIVASKKPMFMKELYVNQSGQQNDLYDMLNLKSISLFGMTAKELLSMKQEDMTANQLALVNHFNDKSLFNLQDNSTMNMWQSQAETMLKEVKNQKVTKSTGELLKANVQYNTAAEKQVRELLLTYNAKVQNYKGNLGNIESDADKRLAMSQAFIGEAKEQLYFDLLDVCDNDVVVATDVMITVCYKLGRCADLLLELFGEQIYNNVKSRKTHVNTIVEDMDGNYTFKYKNYAIKQVEIA